MPRKTLADVTASSVPKRFKDMNLAALEKGWRLASGLAGHHETFPEAIPA